MTGTPVYRPEVFQVGDIDQAKRIILTPEHNVPTEERWETETPYLVDLIAEALSPREDSVLLDYGCGVGRIAKGLIEKCGCRIVGADISGPMRQLAPGYVGSPRFAAMGPSLLDALVAKGLRLDGGYAVWVIQHCPRPEDDIARIHRALRPGAGFFILNNRNRAVPTDRGWTDDGKNDEALIDARFEAERTIELDPAAIGPDLTRRVFAKLWRRGASEAA